MDTRSRIVPTDNEALSQAPLALHSVDAFRALDHTKEAAIARLTGGLSPAALSLAVADWLIHLSSAPGKRLQLAALAVANARQIGDYMLRSALGGSAPALTAPAPEDHRFRADAWQTEPYRLWLQTFLLTEQWWQAATHDVPGTTKHHEDVVWFSARQMLDIAAPSNFAVHQPRGRAAHERDARREPSRKAPVNAFDDARRQAGGQPAAGIDAVQGRRRPRRDTGQGRVSQSSDRAHPVQPDDRRGRRGTGADRARVDHEVLHPRPFAAQLAGPFHGRTGLYGVLHLMAQRGRRRSRVESRGLPDTGRHGRARRRDGDHARTPGSCDRLLPRRHAAVHRRGGDGGRRRRTARLGHRSLRRKPTSRSRARCNCSSTTARSISSRA